jgi:MFS family permease
LMGGLTAATSWTHLILGFVIAGFGSGMVNPPLASTAVGVVRPERSGMASGVNTTFRQIGIAVGIATYGTIFTSTLTSGLHSSLAPLHLSAADMNSLVLNVKEGYVSRILHAVPPSAHGIVFSGLRSSFANSLNDLFIVSGILALAGALCAFVFIRPKDFVAQGAPSHAA